MRLARWQTIAGSCFLAALLSVPAWSSDTDYRRSAVPGTLNYVEGQASIESQTLDAKDIGTAGLQNGQVLETGNGKAEILLTPGVYLRLGNNSSVKMISNSLTDTQVGIDQGEAMVEVDQLYKENNLRISQPGAETRLVKTGLYDFDAANGGVRVFDGKAVVTADDHNTTLKKNHQLELGSAKLRATSWLRQDGWRFPQWGIPRRCDERGISRWWHAPLIDSDVRDETRARLKRAPFYFDGKNERRAMGTCLAYVEPVPRPS